MDVRLTAEQTMLLEVADVIGRRYADDSAADGWAALQDAGLVGLGLPAVGGSAVDAVLVAERLAAAACAAPFVGSAVWAPALLQAAEARDLLDAVLDGAVVVAPVVAADLSFGGASSVVDAQIATMAVVLDADGTVRTAPVGDVVDSVDLSRDLRRCGPTGDPVGRPLAAAESARIEALALVLVAADLVGAAAGALDAAVGYVRDRHQFGRPVGSFQAVQHMAAHAAMQVESARSLVWRAAWSVDAIAPDEALTVARQAKAWASETALAVGETSLQMFGGVAFTWEMPAHRRQRRILFDRALLGDENAQYDALAAARLGATA